MATKKQLQEDDFKLDPSQRYLNDERLPRAGIDIEWTPERVRELKQCKKNIKHFAENFFYIVTLDDGKQKIQLYRGQKRILTSLSRNRFVIVCASRQSGKCLALDTPIETPTGWTTMGDIKEGDWVIGSNGEPTEVLMVHNILYNRPCYKIIFSTGEEIIADDAHRWFVQSHYDRCYKRSGQPKTTKQLLDKITVNKKNPQLNYSVQNPKALQLPEKQFIIDPYLLGLWLGDGFSGAPGISVSNMEKDETVQHLSQFKHLIREERSRDGHYFIWLNQGPFIENKQFITVLKEQNLYKNKHIPSEYFRGSKYQRLELLKGLMDSDGTSCNRKCVFVNTNEQLADDVLTLVRSLGFKATKTVFLNNKNPKGTKIGKPLYRITFNANEYVFKLHRKKNNQSLAWSSKQEKHYIKSIEPVESVPVRCITVDADDEQFVIGHSRITTMNTTLMTIYALWFTCFNSDKRIVIVANKEKTAIMILRRIKLAYQQLPNWLKPGLAQWAGTEVVFENGSSIAISTTTGSAVRGESVNCIIIDEMAHIEDHLIEDFWASVIPVISSSRKGTTKIFAVSTPKGTGNKFHEIFTQAEAGEQEEGMRWNAERIDWYEIPGRGKKWKASMMAALGGDPQLFDQEFNNVFLETGESAIDGSLIEHFRKISRKPLYSFEDGNYKIWDDPKEGRIYGIGVDVSEGVGRAASVAQVLDLTDLTNIQQVASYHNNMVHPTTFAEVLNRIGNHWGRCPLLIERNSCGAEVINDLYTKHHYNNIVAYNPDNSRNQQMRLGVYSHTNTKYHGVMNLRYWLNTLKVVNLYDLPTVQELQTFVRYPNGTWKAKQGNNIFDDRVMSLVWALFLLHEHICHQYYDVVDYDDNGKPLKIRNFELQAPVGFSLDPFFQRDDAPIPAIIGMGPTDGRFTAGDGGVNELIQQGWRPL